MRSASSSRPAWPPRSRFRRHATRPTSGRSRCRSTRPMSSTRSCRSSRRFRSGPARCCCCIRSGSRATIRPPVRSSVSPGCASAPPARPCRGRATAEHPNAFRIDVPAGVSSLEVRFQQLLSLHDDGYSSVLTRKIGAVAFQGAILYPAGHQVSRIDVDASVRFPPAGSRPGRCDLSRESDGWVKYGARLARDARRFAGLRRAAPAPHRSRRRCRPAGVPRRLRGGRGLARRDRGADRHPSQRRSPGRPPVRRAPLRPFRHPARARRGGDVARPRAPAVEREQRQAGLLHRLEGQRARPLHDPARIRPFVERQVPPPARLVGRDFNAPTRNSLLWVYEGHTEYWGNVLAARTGMYTLDEARDRLAHEVAWLQSHAGRQWRSVQDTTYDPITMGRQLRLDWNSWQRYEDYYDEGSLIWLDADTRIRELSGGQRSLDDFARALLRRRGRPHRAAALRLRRCRRRPSPRAGLRLGASAEGAGRRDQRRRAARRADASGLAAGLERQAERAGEGCRCLPRGHGLPLLDRHPHRQEGRDRAGDVGQPGVSRRPRQRADVARRQPPGVQARAAGRGDHGGEGARPSRSSCSSRKAQYRVVRLEYRGGLRYPTLERIEGAKDWLTPIMSAR